LFLLGVFLWDNTLSATELVYKWKVNTSYTFSANQKDDVTTAAMGMAKDMAPEMNGTINSVFDYTNGMFVGIARTLTTTIDMLGMKMTVKSVLEMKKK
jgi:hypothetical protein